MFNKKYIKSLHNQVKSQDKIIENLEYMVRLDGERNEISEKIISNLESQIKTLKGHVKYLTSKQETK